MLTSRAREPRVAERDGNIIAKGLLDAVWDTDEVPLASAPGLPGNLPLPPAAPGAPRGGRHAGKTCRMQKHEVDARGLQAGHCSKLRVDGARGRCVGTPAVNARKKHRLPCRGRGASDVAARLERTARPPPLAPFTLTPANRTGPALMSSPFLLASAAVRALLTGALQFQNSLEMQSASEAANFAVMAL